MSDSPIINDLLLLNKQLLESIMAGDWETYSTLCDPSISAFEPEARGELAEGLDFHRFYFDLGGILGPHNITMVRPLVRMLGEDVAVISYIRLMQRMDESSKPVTTRCEETRVWQRRDGKWRHVHFHRSTNA
jgi:hypothetical protein